LLMGITHGILKCKISVYLINGVNCKLSNKLKKTEKLNLFP